LKMIGLVTCRDIPEPDPDEQILIEAIRDAGGDAELVAWDDPGVDLTRFDRLILRSCWDYPWREAEFRNWLLFADGNSQLFNPFDVVSWNLHKGYLLELSAAGVPVVPTHVLGAGSGSDRLLEIIEAEGWNEIVLKPAVSAGSWRTDRFGAGESTRAVRFVKEHGSDRDLLIQPYIRSVDHGGERANVFIAGRWTHCVSKHPRFHGSEEQVGDAQQVLGEDRDLGQSAIECAPGPILYGRVDTVRDEQGEPMVAELELIEPTLFLKGNLEAQRLFARACLDTDL